MAKRPGDDIAFPFRNLATMSVSSPAQYERLHRTVDSAGIGVGVPK